MCSINRKPERKNLEKLLAKYQRLKAVMAQGGKTMKQTAYLEKVRQSLIIDIENAD